jgi:hypothetical protein
MAVVLCFIFNNKLHLNHANFQDIKLNGARVPSTSEVGHVDIIHSTKLETIEVRWLLVARCSQQVSKVIKG